MLERLVNEDTAAAEELFHEYVVAKSREIYQDLIESEISEEEHEDEDDEEVDESSDSDDEDDDVDENYEDIAIEGDDDMGGDPTDDLEKDLDAEMDDDMDDKDDESKEDMMQDLGSIIDELQAKFDALSGDEDDMDMMDMDKDEEMKDDFELETVREYVEKVPAGHGAEKKGAAEHADNKKSTVDNMKNDMGGTTANILSSKEDANTTHGELKGTGLLKGKAQEDNAGNINVPGGKAGSAFSTKESGHGAEKKGAAEQSDKGAQSLFRGKR